jgi:hypothetical protein
MTHSSGSHSWPFEIMPNRSTPNRNTGNFMQQLLQKTVSFQTREHPAQAGSKSGFV